MYYLTFALLVSFIIASYVPSAETEETFYYRPISEEIAVESLVKIEPSQVLPIIRQLRFLKMRFLPPTSLEKVITAEGRIINGTQFTTDNKIKEYFFCPKENSDMYCLVPTEFQGLKPLECASEPKLIVSKRGNISCGMFEIGKAYAVFYKICPIQETDQSDDTKSKEILLYEFCFDEENKKTIFTNHFIDYPELLDSKALSQERSVKFHENMTSGLLSSNLQFADPLLKRFEAKNYTEDQEQNKHVYRTQKFTPPEDFAFASWKKSTYRDFNIAFQHEALMSLWEEINDSIKNQFKKMYAAENIEFSVHTGVFNLTSAKRKDGQKYNVWVKMIYAYTSDDIVDEPSYGMVILMNNFIDSGTESVTSSQPTERLIIDYCEDDRCEETLTKKFQNVGGRVRCCSVNHEFQQLFYWEDFKDDLPSSHRRNSSDDEESDSPTPILRQVSLLHIPGINELAEKNTSTIYVQNTEVKGSLYYEPISEQEAVDSLVEIQTKQILPIVQLLNNVDMSLVSPKSVEKVFLNEGRIINGTTFTSENETEQVLLCTNPEVKNNEYCLVAKTFHRLEPLECAESHLQIKELEDVSCGANETGKSNILYYEICENGPTMYKTREIKIFEVCYDENNKRTIFTRHSIGSPELLDSKVLSREHSLKFKLQPYSKLYIGNTLKLMATYNEEMYNSRNTKVQNSNLEDPKPRYHIYKLQKFTPPEDLAFGAFRKAAYSYFNVEYQQEALIPLWNEINDLIKDQAKKMYANERVRFAVHTGVVNLSHIPVEEDEDQPNAWVKLIYAKTPNAENPISGLVILINNYIYHGPESTTSEPSEKSMVNYCEDDACDSTLKAKFKNAGSLVRCCSVSERFKTMFWWHDNFKSKNTSDVSIPLLHIPGVN